MYLSPEWQHRKLDGFVSWRYRDLFPAEPTHNFVAWRSEDTAL